MTSSAVELAIGEEPVEWASSEWEGAQTRDLDIQLIKRYVERQMAPKRPERQALSSAAQK